MLNEEMMKYRLESLKMAYEFIFKIGSNRCEEKIKTISVSPECSMIEGIVPIVDGKQIRDDLHDIFDLSEINLDYIIHGTLPDDEEYEEE